MLFEVTGRPCNEVYHANVSTEGELAPTPLQGFDLQAVKQEMSKTFVEHYVDAVRCKGLLFRVCTRQLRPATHLLDCPRNQ
jgi:hypothetical protein